LDKWLWRTREKKSKEPICFFDLFKGRSYFVTKVVVSFTAIAMGVGFLLVFVYSIFPSFVSDTAKNIEQDLAIELYEKTILENSYDISLYEAEQVFVQPVDTNVLFARDCFAPVLSDNPDIVGRVSLRPLGITYLVTQADDNEYYLSNGYDKQKSKSGAIFLDYRSNTDVLPLYGHYILYGHNMRDGSMFHNLAEYKNELFFYDNLSFRFDTLYEDYEWEIFSAYVTDTDFYFIDTDFETDEEWLTFLYQIKSKSMYKTDTKICSDDVLLTLCTCSYEFNDARFVIHARLKDN